MPEAPAARFHFLYRQAEGRLNREGWLSAVWPPIAIAVGMTIVWVFIAPGKPRDLTREPLFDARTAFTYAYLVTYAFALILCAVALYFVNAKRFADRALPVACAGLAPLALLFAGAAHWYVPRSDGMAPAWIIHVIDLAAIATWMWTAAELALGRTRSRG